MKRSLKTIIAAILIMVMATVSFASAELNPNYNEDLHVDTFQMVYFDDNVIALQWPAFEPSSYMTHVGYHIEYKNEIFWKTDSTTATGVVFPENVPGVAAYYSLYADYISSNGSLNSYYMGSTYVNTTPLKITKDNFDIDYISGYSHKVSFRVYDKGEMSGCEFQLRNAAGKLIGSSKGYSYSDNMSYSDNTVYKFRARTYYTNSKLNETFFGKWSSYKYFLAPKFEGTYKYDVKGLNLKIYKNSKVSKFKVYVSTDKNKQGKLAKTVSITDTKTKTVKLNKYGDNYMKKGTTYYIRIVPIIKIDGKEYTSAVYGETSYYCSK